MILTKKMIALFACVCFSGAAASAAVIIEGPQSCAVALSYSNTDVIIRNVTIDNSACASCNFTVIVTNGTITVDQGGIAAFGAAGTDAQAGDVCVVGDQVPAGTAHPGCNVTLRSVIPVSGSRPRPLGVYVHGNIDVHGGNGGQGVAGNSETPFPGTCGTCGPDNGIPGSAGAAGGTVTILSEGPVDIPFGIAINTSGGTGGNGGNGGFGYRQGPGLAAAGSNGGPAGSIQISYKALGGAITIGGSLVAQGGSGGSGGNGASSNVGISTAASAGSGASGGKVSVSGYSLSMSGSINTSGGTGGFGGQGASSPIPGFICDWCPYGLGSWIEICTGVISASNAGNGGNGGSAGSVSLSVTSSASFGAASVIAEGGHGGDGNIGGRGASGFTDCPADCSDPQTPDHINQCPGIAANGHPGSGGAGGAGGSVKVAAASVPSITSALFDTAGGCGGHGGRGADAICVIKTIDHPPGTAICSAIGATAGGAGGSGGGAGSVTFSLGSNLVGVPGLFINGGAGGGGGDGGNGFDCQPDWLEVGAAGGTGGFAGSGGVFSATGQPSMLSIAPRIDCDPQEQVGGEIIRYKGLDGAHGRSDVGCPCGGV